MTKVEYVYLEGLSAEDDDRRIDAIHLQKVGKVDEHVISRFLLSACYI